MNDETATPTMPAGVASLTEAERRALEELVFEMQPKKTLRSIAERLRCSTERVRQIEAAALRKLRRASEGWR